MLVRESGYKASEAGSACSVVLLSLLLSQPQVTLFLPSMVTFPSHSDFSKATSLEAEEDMAAISLFILRTF